MCIAAGLRRGRITDKLHQASAIERCPTMVPRQPMSNQIKTIFSSNVPWWSSDALRAAALRLRSFSMALPGRRPSRMFRRFTLETTGTSAYLSFTTTQAGTTIRSGYGCTVLILDDLESQIKYALTEKQRLDTEGPAVVKRAFVLAPFLESGDLRPVDPDQEEANRSDIERMIGSGRWIGDAYEYTDCCGHRLRWEMQHAEQVVEFDITLSAGSVGTGLALWRYPLIPFAVVGDLILSPIYVLGGIVFIFAMQ